MSNNERTNNDKRINIWKKIISSIKGELFENSETIITIDKIKEIIYDDFKIIWDYIGIKNIGKFPFNSIVKDIFGIKHI